MNSRRHKASIRFFALLFLFTVPVSFFSGCGGDSEYKRVDFSKTVAISHPDTHLAQGKLLRVAVAAMISPKETFIYYRELIDYIGRKAGRGIQLIQRKTYGEINALFLKGEIDLAFICTGPTRRGKLRVRSTGDPAGARATVLPVVPDRRPKKAPTRLWKI